MKKFLVMFLVTMICLTASVAFGAAGGTVPALDDADWAGAYAINSLTVTPIGTDDWINGTAELVVGSTYTVDMNLAYNDDPAAGGDQAFAYNLTSALTIGTTVFNQTATADNLTYQSNQGVGEWTDEVNTADYSFRFDNILITDAMLGLTTANIAFSGSGEAGNVTFSSDYNINVSEAATAFAAPTSTSAPVPEPTTILLLGSGLFGLVGISRRKKG